MSLPNFSILAIPVYHILSLYPHLRAANIAKAASNIQRDKSNPNSTTLDAQLRKALPASTYAAYSRAEAAHRNGMENLPLFIGAVILGNMAKLSTESLDTFAGGYLVTRFLYTMLYLKTEDPKKSVWRSLSWAVGTFWALGVIGRAGWVLA